VLETKLGPMLLQVYHLSQKTVFAKTSMHIVTL